VGKKNVQRWIVTQISETSPVCHSQILWFNITRNKTDHTLSCQWTGKRFLSWRVFCFY